MNITSHVRNPLDLGRASTEGLPDLKTRVSDHSNTTIHANAARKMSRGRRLVIAGFVVAIVGIVAYCVVLFGAATNPTLGAILLKTPGWLVGPTLGAVGLGTLFWLVGSFMYLTGAMDSGPEGPDPQF